MLVRDYLLFIKAILISEWPKVKRLGMIVVMGSFLMFFISLSTALIKAKISQTYENRTVLVPVHRQTQEIETEILIPLVTDTTLQEIESHFEDTYFIRQTQEESLSLVNLSLQQNATLTYDINPFSNQYLISEQVLMIYGWQMDDYYQVNATIIEFSDTHHLNVDLLVPSQSPFINNSARIHPFLTLQTPHDPEIILSFLNQKIVNPTYQYQIENFDMSDLLVSLIQAIEKGLLGFSFIIFVVSSSNIGTIMPYFIHEFKDEIMLLRQFGLSQKTIHFLFLWVSLLILIIALSLSLGFSFSVLFLFSLWVKLKVQFHFFKLLFLFGFQLLFGALFAYQAIKKVSVELTYL